MNFIKDHNLLHVTEEEFHKVRQFYDIDNVDTVKESLEMIREWCEKQDHLKMAYEYLNNELLERLLVLSRGSVEGTKIKIDKLCTARGLMPELCLNRNVEEFHKFNQCTRLVTLPKLNPVDQARMVVIKLVSVDMENFDMLSMFRYLIMMGDYRLHCDYNLSERYIADFENFPAKYLTKLNPMIIRKAQALWTGGYGAKISGIHFINASSIVDKLVIILKQSLKEKVANRLYVHESYEDLRKHLPKEVLPNDFGGDLPSLAVIAKWWDDLFKSDEGKKIIADTEKLVSDETKRSAFNFNEEYLGMPGSFRQLNVD